MFGYIRPWKPELRIDDFELYKSVYCSLCERLGKDYGFSARFILSYDAVFLAVIVSLFTEHNCKVRFRKECCGCNPLKKCTYCDIGNDAVKLAAAFSVISFYYKLSDTQSDENFFKASVAGFLKLMFRKKKNTAAENYPQLDRIVSDMLDLQLETEKIPGCSVDRAADPTAKMLSDIMRTITENDALSEEYARFGYFLGRWIYLIDMTDDFNSDKKSGSFNPLIFKFCDNPKLILKNPEVNKYCSRLLKQTLKNIFSSYRVISPDSSVFKTLADNIVFEGLYNMSELVLSENNNHKKYKFLRYDYEKSV